MASPVNDAFAVPAGTMKVYAGRAGPPSWMPPIGQWGTLPNSALNTSGAIWSGTSPGGSTGPAALIRAWCGGVLNTVGVYRAGAFVAGAFLIIFGGGHGDYGGNEVYAYGPLQSNTPTWSRITDPTIPAPCDEPRKNGYPVARHTYDTLQYDPALNRMYCTGCPGYYNQGYVFSQCDVFEFGVNPGSANPWSTLDTGFPTFNSINSQQGYDPLLRQIWATSPNNASNLLRLDIPTGAWTSWYKDNPNGASNSRAAFEPNRKLLVMWGSSGQILVQDTSAPTSGVYAPTVAGSGPGVGGNVLAWDRRRERFVAWARTGKTVYFLTLPNNAGPGGDDWSWSSYTPASGDTPSASASNGTYGRWQYVELDDISGIVVMPEYHQPICFLRLD